MIIIPRGNEFYFSGTTSDIKRVIDFFTKIEKNYSDNPNQDFMDSFYLEYSQKQNDDKIWSPKSKLFTTYKGKVVYPKTKNQEIYIKSLFEHTVTFGLGPSGTGKTFLSVACACNLFHSKKIDRIILTRPAVEAGENLGFLPGDLNQKVDPYLKPIYDNLYECLGFEKTQNLLGTTKIEIVPIAFMRGRSLSNCFIILDEAQNCTIQQLKMVLTRIGENSKICITGDISQIDIEIQKSGLSKVAKLFKDEKYFKVIEFNRLDIVRNRLIETILQKFEKIEY